MLNRSDWMVALGFITTIVVVALFMGCDEPVIDWDPATMRCRRWEQTIPVGPFLKDEECVGKQRPIVINPEVQP